MPRAFASWSNELKSNEKHTTTINKIVDNNDFVFVFVLGASIFYSNDIINVKEISDHGGCLQKKPTLCVFCH